MMKRVACFLVVSVVLAPSAWAAREGFGFSKRAADMIQTVPPALNAPGKKATVTAQSRSRFGTEAERLRQYTEELITRSGSFEVGPSGDVVVAIDLDRMEVNTRKASKVENTSEKYKDKDGKTRYRNVPVTKYYTELSAAIAGGYTISDRRGNKLDSGDFDRTEQSDHEYVVPDPNQIEEKYLRTAAQIVAGRIVPTQRTVRVLLPRGSFEKAIPFAEKGDWQQYLQAVSNAPAKSDPGTEAYRQYAMGVAREALAYASTNPRESLEALRAAGEHYRAAINAKPAEKLFVENYSSLLSDAGAPLPRLEASMKAYESWTSGPAAAPVMMASAKPAQAAKGAALQNQNIIDMTKAGLGEENIVLAIDSAPSLDFDTSPNGLIALSKAGVSKNVIAHMQRKTKR